MMSNQLLIISSWQCSSWLCKCAKRKAKFCTERWEVVNLLNLFCKLLDVKCTVNNKLELLQEVYLRTWEATSSLLVIMLGEILRFTSSLLQVKICITVSVISVFKISYFFQTYDMVTTMLVKLLKIVFYKDLIIYT